MGKPLNILVVDDTITYRTIISQVVEGLPDVRLAGTANNGKIAMVKLTNSFTNATEANPPIDMVLLDVEMPEMNGLETLAEIKRLYPKVGVVMISGMSQSSADITIKALECGALDFIPKPTGSNSVANIEDIRTRLVPILRLFEQRLVLRQSLLKPNPLQTPALGANHASHSGPTLGTTARPLATTTLSSASSSSSSSSTTPLGSVVAPATPSPAVAKRPKQGKVSIVAIGVSTGGPTALGEVITKLPAKLGVPIVMVQHMPPLFTASLAKSLDLKSAVTVKEAEDGEVLKADTVYIAPGGRHMTLVKMGSQISVQLTDTAPVNSCRPAVDVLFDSVAEVYGRQLKQGAEVLSVILTGMGQDGCRGVKQLRDLGGYCYTQTEDTCVVYGMPRAVDEAGISDKQVALSAMAKTITDTVLAHQTSRV
jgi:two-component system, chemotaxis family, protein-glutamate methylesterase/glutaminase